MSYSRWSNSSWYTFWNASSGKTRETQVLSAWYSLDHCTDWTYEEVQRLFKNAPEQIIMILESKYGLTIPRDLEASPIPYWDEEYYQEEYKSKFAIEPLKESN